MNFSNNEIVLNYKNDSSPCESAENFDYVICAIPFTALRNICRSPSFSIQKEEAIRELGYSNAQKTFFLCKERFWEKNKIN